MCVLDQSLVPLLEIASESRMELWWELGLVQMLEPE